MTDVRVASTGRPPSGGLEASAPNQAAAQFFVDWVRERMERIEIQEADKKRAVMKYQEAALTFWRDQLAKANAPSFPPTLPTSEQR